MFLILILIFLCALYYYGTRPYNYWRDRNVPHNKPTPFFGNNFESYMQKISEVETAKALYHQFPDAPYVGYYRGFTPELIIRDPDVIKNIMTTDFDYFFVRGLGRDPKVEPMLNNPFHAEGDQWKMLRQRLTPAFTTGKLRNMFPLIIECAETLQHFAEQKCESAEPVNVREMMARFTTDFIGACGFGIKMNSLTEAKSEFRKIGQVIFTTPLTMSLKIMLKELFPKTLNFVKPFDQWLEDSVVNLVKSIIEQRNYKPIGRNDFIDLLLELKSQGKIVCESSLTFNDDGSPKIIEREVDLLLMAGQVFIFFAAGFETSSAATSYTLHQLAYNPQVQEKVQQEIDRVMRKHDNKLCYDAVKEMKYLECTFNEGLRMFPSLGVLNRTCTKKYQIPGSDIVIEKGVKIVIPVAAIQNDEKYYKNPEEFDPDRFLPEAVRARHKFVYLPFGEGPRACIGTRLGQMQSLAGLAAVLHKFTFEPAPPSAGGRRDLIMDPTGGVIQTVKGGLPLLIRKREMSLS